MISVLCQRFSNDENFISKKRHFILSQLEVRTILNQVLTASY